MNWFFIALLGPLAWSISNHLDKYLLSKHLHGTSKEALALYSTLVGILVLPIACLLEAKIFDVNFSQILILIFSGVFSSIGIYLYLCALENEEASLVVPFFQAIPVLGLIFGYVILGELLSITQLTGCAIVILGAIILSLEITEIKRVTFKRKMFLLMLSSAFYYAAYEALFKFGAGNANFWIATFWQYFGLFIFGLIIFVSSSKYREDFTLLLRRHNWKLFSINITNEGLTILGNTAYNFALLLAPLGLVMTTTSYQPVFVFIEGVLLTIFFPHITEEKIQHKHLAHKISALLIVFIGTWILYNM